MSGDVGADEAGPLMRDDAPPIYLRYQDQLKLSPGVRQLETARFLLSEIATCGNKRWKPAMTTLVLLVLGVEEFQIHDILTTKVAVRELVYSGLEGVLLRVAPTWLLHNFYPYKSTCKF